MKIIRYIFYTFRANKIIKTFMRKKYIKYPKQKNNHIYTIFTNQNSFLSRQMISDLRDLKYTSFRYSALEILEISNLFPR